MIVTFPLSSIAAELLSRTTIIVSVLKVGRTSSTKVSVAITSHDSAMVALPIETEKSSILEPLFSIVRITLLESPGMS
ncbi:MAG TPA: hypothetical protein EYN46_01820 [Candidatus Poseidoniales archaeon]|nr:hypothetical protein [Candidatus Poseidoniales archaeon]